MDPQRAHRRGIRSAELSIRATAWRYNSEWVVLLDGKPITQSRSVVRCLEWVAYLESLEEEKNG